MRSARSVVVVFAAATMTAYSSGALAHASPFESGGFEGAVFGQLCTPTDPALAELSGMVAFGDGFYAVGDSGSDDSVFELDMNCAVRKQIPVPIDPFDVEDLALSGRTLVLSDTGDNTRTRETIALITMNPETGEGALRRLTYPDGAHDAESILVDPQGHVFVVTKEFLGSSGVYTPVRDEELTDLPQPGPTPLKRVGTVSIGSSGMATGMFTGGAVSADGSVLALRTYTDVYVYEVVDGDIAATLAGTEPLRIPAPAQPQGESVTFTPSGDLVIGSESAAGALPPIHLMPAVLKVAGANGDSPKDSSADAGVATSTLVWGGMVVAAAAVGVAAFVRSRRS